MLAYIPPRPNRLEDVKDEDYHVRYARWAIGNYNLYGHQNFVGKYLTNVAFYKGDQWIFDEDLEAFLMDESGEVRNRIKWIHNMIKPFVEYYRGSAIKMDLSSEVISTSRESRSRRELALDKLLYWAHVAERLQNSNPEQAEQIRKEYGLGQDEASTKELFDNLYVDEYVKVINWLKIYISEVKNDLSAMKVKVAEDLALSGIGILRENDRNQEQIWNRVAPERFIFDMSAEHPELRDAEFMGEFHLRSAVDIFEEHQELNQDTRYAIENSSMSNVFGLHNLTSFYINYAQKLPTYEMYWRDIELTAHGAFYDEFGYPMLCEVSEKYPIENLIPVKELQVFVDGYAWIRTILNDGRKKITKNLKIIPTDQVRFCKFIPAEYISSPGGGTAGDIVLDWGIRPYSQRYSFRYENLDWPYKVATYSYILGEIMSPIESLISPQRFMNRVLSVAESHINNSRGAGTIIDKDIIDPQDGEEGILRNMNQSKPVFVRAQRQVNNSIGQYDATIGAGTLNLFNIADNMKVIANDVFGGGQQIMGQGGVYRATAGVANQNLSQGVTMQEPFFFGIERIYMQAYNSMVNRGKRIYTANQRQLAMEVGDEGVVIFELSSDYDLEDFRCKVIRSASFYDERDAANQMLMTFLQMQMIDDKTFAARFNNSTMMDVSYALREYTGLKVEAAKQQVAEANRQAPIAAQQQVLADEAIQMNENKMLEQERAIEDGKNNTKVISEAIKAVSNEKVAETNLKGKEKKKDEK